MEILFQGVARVRLGEPEKFSPVSLRSLAPDGAGLEALPLSVECPLDVSALRGEATARGYELSIPLSENEELYGFGLQFHSFRQRKNGQVGLKKTIRVNSDPVSDTGDSHAPVPFYVSTKGYGVLVDTARYATFYCGCAQPPAAPQTTEESEVADSGRDPSELVDSIRNRAADPKATAVRVDIPHARGADVYVFWGAELREAVQRYNLFSGGGCLPPRWGLGHWFRVRADFNQQQVRDMAVYLRERQIPCDVIGLEPGWQTAAYPCSFVWSDKFPDPGSMVRSLAGEGYRINLWTHLFVHPTSPVYAALGEHSGDYTAFSGLVPDLSLPQAREILKAQHAAEHVSHGVSGYKLDECDNSDCTGIPWSFPEITRFPSGMDGELMHSALGTLYQETVDQIFRERNRRTYNSVRCSHALAAPYPFVLYSDLYNHRDFVRALVNSGFSGLLWSPEVRHAVDAEDLVRRLQTVVCSPQALVNAWYIQNPPWEQWDTELNNAGERAEGWQNVEAICRGLLELRMQLVPYLYAAFARYREEGLSPFRALVQDYPDDASVRTIDDQYMMGDSLLVAPLFAGEKSRQVYLPQGQWFDFWTHEKFEGGRSLEYSAPLERIPLFVKGGALLPLAAVTAHSGQEEARELTVRVYGAGDQSFTLFEDDGETYDFQDGAFCRLTLTWSAANGAVETVRSGEQGAFGYRVALWQNFA